MEQERMNMRIDDIVKLHESRREVHWLKGEIERILELNALSGDARENEMARQLTAASRKLFDYENRIECLERLYMLAAAEADRIRERAGRPDEAGQNSQEEGRGRQEQRPKAGGAGEKRDGEGGRRIWRPYRKMPRRPSASLPAPYKSRARS